MNTRRNFILALASGALAVTPGVSALQAASQRRRIGVLLYNSPQVDPIGPFVEGLKALGYVDGNTVEIDYAYAEGKVDRLPEQAAALVARKPDVIWAYGGDVAPQAKRATSSIPIVVMVSNDPVGSGLVASLS